MGCVRVGGVGSGCLTPSCQCWELVTCSSLWPRPACCPLAMAAESFLCPVEGWASKMVCFLPALGLRDFIFVCFGFFETGFLCVTGFLFVFYYPGTRFVDQSWP